jgi:hypothetical protein
MSCCLLLLPWLEAAFGLGIGVSVLVLFQVEPTYLDCRGVGFAKEASLLTDVFASPDPTVYLIAAQFSTAVVIFVGIALCVSLAQWLLVRRSVINQPKQLGVAK